MRTLIASCLAATLAATGVAAVPTLAQSRDDQGEARREMHAGNVMKLRDLERRVLPSMKGAEYLGPAYDSRAKVYRFKFIKDGRVMFVDVDARTGRVLRRSE